MYAYYFLMNVRNNKMNVCVPFKQPINNVQFRKLEGVYISASEKNITKCIHTGNVLPEDVDFFQSNGVNSVFIKPLNKDLF
jgi:hypothetical protein